MGGFFFSFFHRHRRVRSSVKGSRSWTNTTLSHGRAPSQRICMKSQWKSRWGRTTPYNLDNNVFRPFKRKKNISNILDLVKIPTFVFVSSVHACWRLHCTTDQRLPEPSGQLRWQFHPRTGCSRELSGQQKGKNESSWFSIFFSSFFFMLARSPAVHKVQQCKWKQIESSDWLGLPRGSSYLSTSVIFIRCAQQLDRSDFITQMEVVHLVNLQ